MNYRHQFHAGNFADVMKHALVVGLVRALQRKPKGFLFVDTHAGRGFYDLAVAAAGDTRVRQPEWPDGIGRLWTRPTAGLPPAVAAYLDAVRAFDRRSGNLDAAPRFYPGSPVIVLESARAVDRLALCESHPAEFAALRREMAGRPRVSVQETDGYEALRGWLPPPERRALVVIDPPFEAQDEFERIVAALREGVERFADGIFAVWYPLTARARADDFLAAVHGLGVPAVTGEIAIAGTDSPLKLKGCGLLVLNPPWQFDGEMTAILESLAAILQQEPGGGASVRWIRHEGGPR